MIVSACCRPPWQQHSPNVQGDGNQSRKQPTNAAENPTRQTETTYFHNTNRITNQACHNSNTGVPVALCHQCVYVCMCVSTNANSTPLHSHHHKRTPSTRTVPASDTKASDSRPELLMGTAASFLEPLRVYRILMTLGQNKYISPP